jgi:glycosyltransferase involved in cell wall biosynthesis
VSDIAVLIPTLRRPDSLARTLRSLAALPELPRLAREIVVADNDPEGSAAATVEALRTACPVPLVYVHVPTPGVATARNAALAATQAPLIAFIDDDEEALPGWLSALANTHFALGADVTFGPIEGVIPDLSHWAADYLQGLFSRAGPAESGLAPRTWGCGNSMMTRATALPSPAPFAVAADQSGGEDDILFQALTIRGGRFGWAADAWVLEHAPAHRATLSYALQRAFAYGQSPSQDAARRRDPLGVTKWMAVGVAQTAVYGAAAAAFWLTRNPRRAAMLDRTARGLGKVFWTRRFEPRFYGYAALSRAEAATGGRRQPASTKASAAA